MIPPPSEVGNPLVSIIVRTHGQRTHFLRECLQSVVDQQYRPLEINVVEDGSTHACRIAADFQQLAGISINYVSLKKSGRCHAGNAGMTAASGTWFNFLDDDDKLLPDHIRLLVKESTSNPALKGVVGGSLAIATKVHSLDPLSYTEKSQTRFESLTFSRWDLWNAPPFPIQACMFHHSLFERYGGLDPELDCLEDWHLWMRYFSEEPLACIKVVTSIYRLPADAAVLETRRLAHQAYLPMIARKRGEVSVSVSRVELDAMATELLRKNLPTGILAIADAPASAGWTIRILIAAIGVVRLLWRKARMLVQQKDRKLKREILSDTTNKVFRLSVSEILAIMPEIQSAHKLANLQLLHRCQIW